MAVKSVEEIIESLRAKIGDDDGDDTLALFEDIADTVNASKEGEGEDWKKKYEENDKQWREKYKNRFLKKSEKQEDEEVEEEDEEKSKSYNYENLFKEG